MSDNKVVGARSEFAETIEKEGYIRGHSKSEALNEIIRLGLPRYLKKFKPKFLPVSNEKQEHAA